MSALHEAARRVVAAWVSTRPAWVQECNEAVLALDAALKAQAGCDTETDCTSQPWCRISGECHRKQAQPEPAQEPLGYLWPTGRHPEFRYTQQKRDGVDGTSVYTTPQPQRPPLTDEEIYEEWRKLDGEAGPLFQRVLRKFARAIERKVRGEA